MDAGRLALCTLMLAVAAGCKPSPATPPGERQEETAKEYARGPHGGRLLGEGAFHAEVTLYERGVPPEFRIYFYDEDKPVAPGEVTLTLTLYRFGGRVERMDFAPEQDFLRSGQVVEEPHSFDVVMEAERAGHKHVWRYSQREGRVELSDDAVRTSAIQIETAGPVKMRSVLSLPGEIVLNGDRLAHVVPRMTGVLREVRKSQGDDVKKGEVLAVLDSRELAEAKRQFIDTAQEIVFEKRAFEREEALWKKNISSEASYLLQERAYHEAQLKHRSARQQLEALGVASASLQALLEQPDGVLTRYEIRAPFDGVLIEKRIATGQAVKEDDSLFTLADLSSVWVDVSVYAKDLNAVKVGQDVTVRSDMLEVEAAGKIVYLGSLVGAETRSAKARVILGDPRRQWRAGLFVTVTVVRDEVTVPVAVKREGLQRFRDWDVVFTRSGNEFEARPLQLGRQDGEWVEVLSGLSPGEKYASRNSFILKADVGKAGASHDH